MESERGPRISEALVKAMEAFGYLAAAAELLGTSASASTS